MSEQVILHSVLLVEYNEKANEFFDSLMVNMLKKFAKYEHVYFVEKIDKPDYCAIIDGVTLKCLTSFMLS